VPLPSSPPTPLRARRRRVRGRGEGGREAAGGAGSGRRGEPGPRSQPLGPRLPTPALCSPAHAFAMPSAPAAHACDAAPYLLVFAMIALTRSMYSPPIPSPVFPNPAMPLSALRPPSDPCPQRRRHAEWFVWSLLRLCECTRLWPPLSSTPPRSPPSTHPPRSPPPPFPRLARAGLPADDCHAPAARPFDVRPSLARICPLVRSSDCIFVWMR